MPDQHVRSFDLRENDREYSLTLIGITIEPTPTCCGYYNERVTWIVFPEVIEVAPEDVKSLKENAKEDARPIQMINRCVILRNVAK